MAVTGAIISGIATVASVATTVQARQEQKEAAREQERANQISRRQNQLQQQENIRRAIARSRVARAQAEAAGGAAAGGGAVATTTGAAGAETTGTAANVGFAIGQNQLSNQRFDALISANRSMNRAQELTQIGQAFGSVSQYGGGGAGFANLIRAGYGAFNNEQGNG